MTKLELILLVLVLGLVGVIWTVSYKACVAKFPDAPTWACMVKP